MPTDSRARWGAGRVVIGTICLLLGLTVGACSPTPTTAGISSAADRTSTTAATATAAAIDPGGSVRPVDRVVTMMTADGQRSAIVHHPEDAGPGAPLVVVLHPAAVSARDMAAGFGWNTVADLDDVVVAYPDGLLDLFQNTWNGGRCCPPATSLGTDDVGFLDSLVTALHGTDDIGEVYAVGFSNGAIMAYAWACARPGTLTGIGVVAGALMTDCPTPAPVSVVAVHGDADDRIPIGGGPGPDDSAFPSLDASLAPFRAADKCPEQPDDLLNRGGSAATGGSATGGSATGGSATGGSATRGSDVLISTWTCTDGHRVVRAVVAGLDHAWPGAGTRAGTDFRSDTVDDATGFLWAQLRPPA